MKEPIVLEKGKVYGMSNGSLDQWDKVQRGKEAFSEVLQGAQASCPDTDVGNFIEGNLARELFSIMRDDNKSTWTNTQRGTGYPQIWEYMNSSIFIRNKVGNFCTVSTTVLAVHKSGSSFYQEQRYHHNNSICLKFLSSLSCIRLAFTVESDVKEHFVST